MPPSALPKATEHEIQAAIVDALRACGLFVYETTAYRQRGSSGVDKGISDLLVCVPGKSDEALAILLEVKKPGTLAERYPAENRGVVPWSSQEQLDGYRAGRIVVAQSDAEACRKVRERIARFGYAEIQRRLMAFESGPGGRL